MTAVAEPLTWPKSRVETTDGRAELLLDLDVPAGMSADELKEHLKTLLARLDDRYRFVGGSGLTAVNSEVFEPGNGPYRVRPTSPSDRPMTVEDLNYVLHLENYRPTPRQRDDNRWAHTDPEIQAKYAGRYVVPYCRAIIGHGTIEEAGDQARAHLTKLGLPNEQVTIIEVTDVDDLFWDI